MSEKFNPDGPEAMFVQADALIEAGNTVGAAELLSRLIDQFPTFGRAYNHLGYLWETKFRDLVKAETYYKACLQYSPEYPAIYYNYAVLLSTQERWEELEDLLSRALQVKGITKAKIYNEFAIMHEVKSNYSEAIEAYRQAIKYSFSQKDIHTYRNSMARTLEKQTFFEQLNDKDRPTGSIPREWN